MKVNVEVPAQHFEHVRHRLVRELSYSAEGVVALCEKHWGKPVPSELLTSTVARVDEAAAVVHQFGPDARTLNMEAEVWDSFLGGLHQDGSYEIAEAEDVAVIRSWLEFLEWVEAEQNRLAELLEVAV